MHRKRSVDSQGDAMSTLTTTPIGQAAAIPPASPAAVPVNGLHHFAYRCRDAEETRHFYEDMLGLPLFHYIRSDVVPSTGEYCPYVHIFFRMTDGSCLAFFDLGDNVAAAPSPNTPAWVNHIALRVDTVAQLEAMKARIEAHGIEVLGVTDHRVFKSIYFFDPNGIRLELCAQVASNAQMVSEQQGIREKIAAWSKEKAERLAKK
jgi:glyoxylase I family protein